MSKRTVKRIDAKEKVKISRRKSDKTKSMFRRIYDLAKNIYLGE